MPWLTGTGAGATTSDEESTVLAGGARGYPSVSLYREAGPAGWRTAQSPSASPGDSRREPHSAGAAFGIRPRPCEGHIRGCSPKEPEWRRLLAWSRQATPPGAPGPSLGPRGQQGARLHPTLQRAIRGRSPARWPGAIFVPMTFEKALSTHGTLAAEQLLRARSTRRNCSALIHP